MSWDYSSKKVGATYTANCDSGYFFVKFSGGGSYQSSTSKTATCKQDGSYEYWSYNDNSTSLGDCISN